MTLGLDMPVQVRRAVILMWVSLIAGFIVSSLEFDSSLFVPMDGFILWMMGLFLLIYSLFAALIVFISRRHNWARISVLLLTVMGAVILVIPWPGIDHDPWTLSAAASQFGLLFLDAVALFWLFTGAGAAWFRRSSPPPGGTLQASSPISRDSGGVL